MKEGINFYNSAAQANVADASGDDVKRVDMGKNDLDSETFDIQMEGLRTNADTLTELYSHIETNPNFELEALTPFLNTLSEPKKSDVLRMLENLQRQGEVVKKLLGFNQLPTEQRLNQEESTRILSLLTDNKYIPTGQFAVVIRGPFIEIIFHDSRDSHQFDLRDVNGLAQPDWVQNTEYRASVYAIADYSIENDNGRSTELEPIRKHEQQHLLYFLESPRDAGREIARHRWMEVKTSDETVDYLNVIRDKARDKIKDEYLARIVSYSVVRNFADVARTNIYWSEYAGLGESYLSSISEDELGIVRRQAQQIVQDDRNFLTSLGRELDNFFLHSVNHLSSDELLFVFWQTPIVEWRQVINYYKTNHHPHPTENQRIADYQPQPII